MRGGYRRGHEYEFVEGEGQNSLRLFSLGNAGRRDCISVVAVWWEIGMADLLLGRLGPAGKLNDKPVSISVLSYILALNSRAYGHLEYR